MLRLADAARGAGDPLRRRLVAGRPPAGGAGRRQRRPVAHEPDRALNAEDLTVTVQAGVTREQLNREIATPGLFFPIDPGANATLGGMAATRASGTNAVRYGTMRENVLGADGGHRQRRGHPHRHARQEEQRRLRPDAAVRGQRGHAGRDHRGDAQALPAARGGERGDLPLSRASTRRCAPPSRSSRWACRSRAANCWTPTPCAPSTRTASSSLREAPMLLMEFHGSEAGVKEQAETVQEIAREHGGEDFEWASTPEERTRLWAARHKAYFAGMQTSPGCRTVTTDTCVPISRLAEMHRRGGGRGRGRRACPTTSSAMWATATSTSPTWSTPSDAERARAGRSAEPAAWCSARSRWKAPAPANTASACTRWAS